MERIWKEGTVAGFEVLSGKLPGKVETKKAINIA
jgi:hypothetical protein